MVRVRASPDTDHPLHNVDMFQLLGLRLLLVASPNEASNLRRDVAPDGAGEVLVPDHHVGLRPSHDPHHRPVRDAEKQEHRRRRVPRVMESGVTNTCRGEQLLPSRVVGSRVHGGAEPVREHPSALGP